MSAVTAEAGSNIAFIKYWGARDLSRVVPYNTSLSMTLDVCRSICSVEFQEGEDGPDEVWLADTSGALSAADTGFSGRVFEQLDRLRRVSGKSGRMRVATRNTFPSSAGIASSASGFTALTTAATHAMGLDATGAELSRLAMKSGSGSASRSAFGGYVEWSSSEDGQRGAQQIHDSDWWRLCDVIVVVDTEPKDVSSREGHRLATSSPYYQRRLTEVQERRLPAVRDALERRDFGMLGAVVEEEAIDMHLIAMSSAPAVFYWKPATLAVLEAVRECRAAGLEAWSTLDAGANVHVICEPEAEPAIADRLADVAGVVSVLRDHTGEAPSVRVGADLLEAA